MADDNTTQETVNQLIDLTDTIRNLARSRAFTLQSDLPAREMTAQMLRDGVDRGMTTADALQLALIQSMDSSTSVLKSRESEALANYLALRREVKAVFDAEEAQAEDKADVEAESAEETPNE